MNKKKTPDAPAWKPCWTLRFCPYGPMVEMFPIPESRSRPREIQARFDALVAELGAGKYKTSSEIWQAFHRLSYFNPRWWKMMEGHRRADLRCEVFGHVCPALFLSEAVEEADVLED